ncbi:MAG: patatin-like phospholipase family protein [Bacteroidia bacterium]
MVFKLRFFIFLLLLTTKGYSQKVGLVLSGGGSSGLAHVGVLKALEEANIPIDYIAGTSMGALVGGMYAMGYTPDEIIEIVTGEEFNQWVFGKPLDRYVYFFRERDSDASWAGIKLRVDSVIQTRFPTSIVSPVNMDFAFLERTAPVSAAANYNFDSLFVPFRCVAADIHNKAEVIFKSGDLGQALRATTTYPFFFKPIVVDDKLLFDGGLYNNFPADIMYRDFLPDVIIGSTVASEMKPPNEDDIISQIKNMLMERTTYGVVCETESMVIIRPEIPKVSILDFDQTLSMISGGYLSTVSRLEDLKRMIPREQDSLELAKKRHNFLHQLLPLKVEEIEIEGLNKNQANYVKRTFRSKKLPAEAETLKPFFYRLAYDPRIKKIYPSAKINPETEKFKLNLQMKLDKDILAEFGGLFSSRPINMGFLGLHYKRINRFGLGIDANTYFGKFYSSVQVRGVFDFPNKVPFQVETDFTFNNFDFFNSASTFFEDVKPSYLIQSDRSFQTALVLPLRNHARFKTGFYAAQMFDDYYQTKAFFNADTADRTNFNHAGVFLSFEHNTLNRKQYASTGSQFYVKVKYLGGEEENIPGSTSTTEDLYKNDHNFFRARIVYDKYLNKKGKVHAGIYGEVVASNQPFFNNTTSTLLQAAAFNVIPESRTLFQRQFRAHNYGAAGIKVISSFTSRLDLRLEGYIFQPHKEILSNADLTPRYGDIFEKRYFAASAALVFHTPIAPIALSFNYYDQSEKPFSLIFTTGFLIFNRRALD